jgi:signal transduction histidine kinase
MLTFLLSVAACTGTVYLLAGALSDLELPSGETLLLLLAVLALGTFTLVVGGRWLRRAASPVGDMLEAAGRIAEGNYEVQVRNAGPWEVRMLARAFNEMAARLKAQEETRRDLLADISHELRTPLTVIQGNLEGMLDGIYPRDEAQIEVTLEETRQMARLIEDLRTLSLAESGALKLQRVATDVSLLSAEALQAFQLQADQAGVRLALQVEQGLPEIEVDPQRMKAVLANLIANALRYTPEGGLVGVNLAREASGEALLLRVHDNGAGIPGDDLPHIFDRFYKSADSRGSGLGLAIAKGLVEAHGGSIEVKSAPGEGSEFRLRVPLEQVEDSAYPRP